MELTLEKYIEDRAINGELHSRLSSLPKDDAELVSSLVAKLSPSANTLRELIRLADEIAARDKISLSNVFSDQSILELLNSDTPRKQLQGKLKKLLERRRYPELARIEDELSNCCLEIANDVGIKLELPKNCEGDAITFTLSAKNEAEFSALAEKLTVISKHEKTKQLFAILKGQD